VATIRKPGNQHYAGWVNDKWMVATHGNTTDYAVVEAYLCVLHSRYNVIAVGYDSWQANYIATRLLVRGVKMIEVRQIVSNMSEPMKLLEAMVLDKQIVHDGNPALEWMISNVVAHIDHKENIFPNKEYPENKIDGAIALIMALSLAYGSKEAEESVYNKRDAIVL